MSSLLIVSNDPQAVQKIEQLAEANNIRARAISALQTAREWLAMHSFDVVLIDARYSQESTLELILLAWKYQPLILAGVFSFTDQIPIEWEAKLIGARIYAPPTTLEQLQQDFKALQGIDVSDPNKLRILLVEDLDAPREIITTYIEGLGYPHVDGASNAFDAMKFLERKPEHYMCVVTDINMPNKNGVQLIAEIRADDRLKHLPIIVLTAYSTAENLIECVEAGASGFLVKPPRKRELREELEKAKRILIRKQDPRLCQPEDALKLEDALSRRMSLAL